MLGLSLGTERGASLGRDDGLLVGSSIGIVDVLILG